MHGQFSWYDLMTANPAAAKRFYPAVTGWGLEEWDQADYTMWTASGVPLGGINPITPEQAAQGVPPHWLAYVTVDDVEGTTNKVRSLGGQVMHGPESIPGVGRFAIIQDPQGAILAIIKSETPSDGFDGTPGLGKFTWHELMTTDYKRAFDFYRQVFGWEKTGETEMGDVGPYLMYGMKGKDFGGIFNRPARVGQMPPSWTYYVNVKDVKKSIDVAKSTGARVSRGPTEIPDGVFAILTDPQGAMFAVFQAKAAAAARPASKPKTKAKKATKSKAKAKARKPKARKAKAAARRPKKAAKSRSKPKAKAKSRKRAKRR